MKSRVSQSSIAQESGCSRPTVACALNERLAHRLSPETRQRVLDSARRLGYVPNHAARRLARSGGKSRIFEQVGFLYLTPGKQLDPACLAMMHGAEEELADASACLVFA